MAKRSADEAKPAASSVRKFLVEFNPPSPIGDKARRMEVEAETAEQAVAIWRATTGFTGALAVPPVTTDITDQAPAGGE